jgi:predicted nucleic acid-binding Zn ribbon protein
MERAGKLIGKLKLPAGAVTAESLAVASWPQAVGKRVASHARAAALKGGCLIVEVEDAIWRRQLFTLQPHILRKLYEILGPGVVSDVEFRVAVPRRLPQRAETASSARDEADQIQDPVFRRLYVASRKRSLA